MLPGAHGACSCAWTKPETRPVSPVKTASPRPGGGRGERLSGQVLAESSSERHLSHAARQPGGVDAVMTLERTSKYPSAQRGHILHPRCLLHERAQTQSWTLEHEWALGPESRKKQLPWQEKKKKGYVWKSVGCEKQGAFGESHRGPVAGSAVALLATAPPAPARFSSRISQLSRGTASRPGARAANRDSTLAPAHSFVHTVIRSS